MGRNISPRVKRQRRIGEKLFAHGEKSFGRRPYPPGQHGPKGSSKLSEYGVRLREKQKAQLTYGLLERQFRTYVAKAKRKTGNTVELLLQLLELRLDNIVYRAGFAKSREGARQLIRHGHIAVNGRRVDVPSFQAKLNDVVALHENSRSKAGVQIVIKEIENYEAPSWITLDKKSMTATVREVPALDASATNINLQLIVEFYSR
jgi:small subunit ribosomal protein S4